MNVRPGIGLIEDLAAPHSKAAAVCRLIRNRSQLSALVEVQTGSRAACKALSVKPERNLIHHLISVVFGLCPFFQLAHRCKQIPVLIHRVHAVRSQFHGKLLLRLAAVQENFIVIGLSVSGHRKKDCPAFCPGVMLYIPPAGQSLGLLFLTVIDVQIPFIAVVLQIRPFHHKGDGPAIGGK